MSVRCHKGWADLSVAFPPFATKDGPACMVAVKGEERVVTAQGSLGRVDKGHGVGEEGVRAGGGHRDPPFVAGRPNLCGRPAQPL